MRRVGREWPLELPPARFAVIGGLHERAERDSNGTLSRSGNSPKKLIAGRFGGRKDTGTGASAASFCAIVQLLNRFEGGDFDSAAAAAM